MNKLFVAAVVVSMSACGFGGPRNELGDGVPQASEVALKLPSSAGQALTAGRSREGLEGETADLYKVTRTVTLAVNGGTAAVLNLVHRITEYPATTATQDSATWGPPTDALSPNTWKLTVTRTAADTYTYTLEGKGKTEADSAFRVVLSGTHHRTGANLGDGSFLIDWDEAAQLPEHGDEVGTLTITYARPTESATTEIDAEFRQVKNGRDGTRIDANYRYRSTPGMGGEFEFQADDDFVGGAAIEAAKIKSRWQQTGAGRSDATISGGDLATPATLNECWDDGFASRYLNNSWATGGNYGAESVCAFTTAQYSTL